MRTVILLIVLLSATTAIAQNIQTSTIEWRSTSTFDVEPGTIVNEQTKVVSSASQITWFGEDGNPFKTMPVNTVTGSWTNVGNNGSIIFNVNSENSSGIVQFWKNGSETKIRIHLVSDTESLIYELTVANFNIQ